VRGNFGDPRTIFRLPLDDRGLDGPGLFGFHFGIDISADGNTPVYPVESGRVTLVRGARVSVRVARGREFEYVHIIPAVAVGTRVFESKSVLGYVLPSAGHIHLSEFRRHRPVNPLAPGHLAPYEDHTRPWVEDVEFRGPSGAAIEPPLLEGVVGVVAEAYDMPSLPVPGPWAGLPVTPALVTWRVTSIDGSTVVAPRAAADFRTYLPPNSRFWRVYARGTYQNMPAIGPTYYAGMPGRYLFRLTSDLLLDGPFRPGLYELTVTASDTRGNRDSSSVRFSVLGLG
jgi:hypothetical protein